MKWIRLDQNLKFGRHEHSAVQIPTNLTIENEETDNKDLDDEKSFEEIVKNVKDLADDFYLEKPEDESSSEDVSDSEDECDNEDDSFPYSEECATFISEKLNMPVAGVQMILDDFEDFNNVEDDLASSSDDEDNEVDEFQEVDEEYHNECVSMFKEIGISFSKFKENETGGNCNMNLRRRSKKVAQNI